MSDLKNKVIITAALTGAVTGFFTGQERENQNSFPADS